MEDFKHKLREIGINIEDVLERLSGNEQLYFFICGKFLKDPNYHQLLAALSVKDFKKAFLYVHTLKGVSANLGFTRMECICKEIQEYIRKSDNRSLEKHMIELAEEYDKITHIIKNSMDT